VSRSTTSIRATLFASVLLAAGVSAAVPLALGDQQVTAEPRDRYGTPTVTIAQGESVTFTNHDVDSHNVTATANGPDGKPLFASATISLGQTARADGTQYLASGSYQFDCTLHPFMKGTLVVTSAGSPVPRPGQPSGGSGPSSGGGSTQAPGSTRKPRKHRHKRHKARHHTKGAASRTVVLRNLAFSPRTLNVRSGDVVRWLWRDGSIPHNVTARSFRSKTQTSGSFAVRFRHRGTFRYVCTLHPQMKGRIVAR
jgi:plastocyanin